MINLIVWGATGQLIVLEELIHKYNDINIVAIFDNDINIKSPIQNIPIYHNTKGFEQWLGTVNPLQLDSFKFAVAIGGDKGADRVRISEYIRSFNINPYLAVHHSSYIASNAIISEGCQILANSTICAKVCVGKYTIINTSSSIDHECVIGMGVHIGPGAKIAGNVSIDDFSFIGTNATILPRIKIGKNTIIGAGSVVTKNIPPFSIAIGNPAKVVKTKI